MRLRKIRERGVEDSFNKRNVKLYFFESGVIYSDIISIETRLKWCMIFRYIRGVVADKEEAGLSGSRGSRYKSHRGNITLFRPF